MILIPKKIKDNFIIMKGVSLPALQKCDSRQKHRKACLPKAYLKKISAIIFIQQ